MVEVVCQEFNISQQTYTQFYTLYILLGDIKDDQKRIKN